MYRSIRLKHVSSHWFENIPTVKELRIDPRDVDDFYTYENVCFSWEHSLTISNMNNMFYMNHIQEIHAMYDIRVHVHGIADSVAMILGQDQLPFTHLSDNFWLLKTFTSVYPLLSLPLHRNPAINVHSESPYTLSFCCCNLTPAMEEIVEDDCYMDGPGKSKFIFTENFFAYIENAEEDDEWDDS